MIADVDEALRTLIRRDALNGADVEVVFEAPTKEWAARRNAPTVDVYLYDIREDLKWRAYGSVDVRNDQGLISARGGPPRYFKLSYLVTAWTQRPEDEHRLLSAVLYCFLRFDALPKDVLSGVFADQKAPLRITIATPPPEDRALSDTWSALGGELKPSLDLVVTAPVDARGLAGVAPLILEVPRISMGGPGGQSEAARGGRHRRRGAAGGTARGAPGGATGRGGGAAGGTTRGAAGGAPGSAAGEDGDDQPPLQDETVSAGQEAPLQEETVWGGKEGQPGRIFRIRGKTEP